MDLRRFACLLFLSTLPLAAQGLPLLPPGQLQPPQPPKSPEDELASLEREKERLLREIDYVKNRVSNAKDLLASKFATRGLSARAIDAGRSIATPVSAPRLAPRPARVMQDDERSNFPEDTMLVVSGTPISRATYDQVRAHEDASIDPAIRGQRSLYDLIRIEGTAAAFGEEVQADVLEDVASQLAAGKTVAELAPKVGTLPGAPADGTMEVTRNSQFGPRLEQVAFDLEVGQTSRPFRHHAGYVYLHKASVEKGTTPQLDKVIVHGLQVPYTTVADELTRAQLAVSTLQIEILVRDKETMQMLPASLRDPANLPEAPADPQVDPITTIRKSLETLASEIEQAKAAGSDAELARLPMLQARFDRLKAELEQVERAQGTHSDPVVPVTPTKPRKDVPVEPGQNTPKDAKDPKDPKDPKPQ